MKVLFNAKQNNLDIDTHIEAFFPRVTRRFPIRAK